MAFCRIVFTVLLISVSCYANLVPVFLWGDLPAPSTKANPLEATPPAEFTIIMKQELIKDPLTVVFIEQKLSVEDLSSRDGAETIYPFLEANLGQSKYLPSVHSPLLTIEDVAPEAVDYIEFSDNSVTIQPAQKFVFINLNDAIEGESRTEMLRRHNDLMADVFENLKKDNENVIGVYTGRVPTWDISESHSRQRRQAQNSNETEDFILDSLRLYVENLELVEGDKTETLSDTPTSSTVINGTSMNTTVNFGDHTFVMNFRTQAGYWFFDSVTFGQGAAEEDLYPSEELFAIEGFSYRCGQRTAFTNVNASRTLVFNNLQVQPYFAPINSSVAFGDAFDCVGFFSGAIWAGLLVTFIILLITFYGIIMMMDIKTMDRFDDPKGKTITINASE